MRPLHQFSAVLIAVIVIAAGYYALQTRGDTTVGVTLTTNPDLNRGLVGHWTFDGRHVDWGSSTAEVLDRSGNANHGNATSTMSATTSPVRGGVGAGHGV
jgi:hypothetical protein